MPPQWLYGLSLLTPWLVGLSSYRFAIEDLSLEGIQWLSPLGLLFTPRFPRRTFLLAGGVSTAALAAMSFLYLSAADTERQWVALCKLKGENRLRDNTVQTLMALTLPIASVSFYLLQFGAVVVNFPART